MLLSDVQFLRVLTSRKPADAVYLCQRSYLVSVPLQEWREDWDKCISFPSPTAHVQSRGIYLIAHHCCKETLEWMQHMKQKQQLRQERKNSNESSSAMSTHDHPPLATDIQQMVTKIHTNACVQRALMIPFLASQGKRSCCVFQPAIVFRLGLGDV